MTTPYISSDKRLPELTPKAIFLGIVLSIVLASANTYLGLFAGMTVSASIPAAVVSMAVLKLFSRSNILENNLVQTSASAGESVAAGVIFTIPALVLMGYWEEFNYWETTFVAMTGGVLGVLFTIPLRSALIVREKLQFPEGMATAEVLKSGQSGAKSVKFLAVAAIVGGFFKFAKSGMGLWESTLYQAKIISQKTFLFFGMNLSPALLAVGYIVGINIAAVVFIGGAISWWIAIPLFISINGAPIDADAVGYGYSIWDSKIRYLGVGAMVVGGLWALIQLRHSISAAFQQGIEAFRSTKAKKKPARTEQDMSMKGVIIGMAAMIVPVFFIYNHEIGMVGVAAFMAVFMVGAGFLFSAVSGYMAGLVGSSNNPVSGSTIATILTASLLLLVFLGTGSAKGPAAALLVGAIVCCAAAIGGDNTQDLKAGYLLGATPFKQQIMQLVGVISAALVVAPVLNLLNTAYGFGPKTAENPQALAAPQATLMKGVTEGVFGGGLPWNFVAGGAVIAVLAIIFDEYLRTSKASFRVPVLALAIGIYLPFELNSTILLGGLIAWVASSAKKRASGAQSGLLFASGLITGEALVGILLAIPIAVVGKNDIFKLVDSPIGMWPGTLLLIAIAYWLLGIAKGKKTI